MRTPCLFALLALGCGTATLGSQRGDAAATDPDAGPPPDDAALTAPTDAAAPVVDAAVLPVADAGAAPDAATAVRDAAVLTGCEVVTNQPGVVFTSTASVPRSHTYYAAFGGRSFARVEVRLDVRVAAWTPKQGQYEIFSILRGRRWTDYAIGYVSFIGPSSRAVVTTANLGLDGAAAPPGGDGRRASASLPVETMHDYHLTYVYDAAAGRRHLDVADLSGAVLRTLEGDTFARSIDVEPEGLHLVLGGEEVEGAPDSTTLGWSFSNVRIDACP